MRTKRMLILPRPVLSEINSHLKPSEGGPHVNDRGNAVRRDQRPTGGRQDDQGWINSDSQTRTISGFSIFLPRNTGDRPARDEDTDAAIPVRREMPRRFRRTRMAASWLPCRREA